MFSVFASSAKIVGSSPDRVKPKTMKLIYVGSPLSTQHYEERAKTGLARNQNNVSEWNNMSTRGLLFQ